VEIRSAGINITKRRSMFYENCAFRVLASPGFCAVTQTHTHNKPITQVAGNPSMSAAGKGVVMSPMPAIPMQAVQSSVTPGVPYFGVMPNPQNSISYAEGRAPRYPANMPPQQPNGLIGPVVGFPETGY
jgi:hypothetical protein